MDARGIGDAEIIEGARRSTMDELIRCETQGEVIATPQWLVGAGRGSADNERTVRQEAAVQILLEASKPSGEQNSFLKKMKTAIFKGRMKSRSEKN